MFFVFFGGGIFLFIFFNFIHLRFKITKFTGLVEFSGLWKKNKITEILLANLPLFNYTETLFHLIKHINLATMLL